jgi:uncharacterized protein DUF4259
MGMWGFEPWDNDLAADWLVELFQKGKIAERVVKALERRDIEEYWPEIRAAAHVVAVLGDVWPADVLRAHHQLAIDKLEAVKQVRDFQGDRMMAGQIDAQIAVLRGRVEAASAGNDAGNDAAIPPQYDPKNAFTNMKSPDREQRLAGLIWINQFVRAPHRWADDWLRDPKTTEAHLPLLDDADPEVAEQALFNINGLINYHPDERILPAAIRLTHSPRPTARGVAASVAMKLGGERCLDDVVRLFKDPDKQVRCEVIRQVASACRPWSKEAHARLREAALGVLGDRSDEVRVLAARLLFRERGGMVAGVSGQFVGVGKPEDLAAVKKAKGGVKSAQWKGAFRELLNDVSIDDMK